jgi:ABC-type lipoprotein export system ATPase subunit
MSFDGSPFTVVLGPNGNGKSTVIHALACAFQPVADGENYKYSSFFTPNSDALWQDSRLEITHSYREGASQHLRKIVEYTKRTDRWTPRYARRPGRDLFYIGIDKCVPLIESESRAARINYSTETIGEQVISVILDKASHILNRRYSAFNIHTSSGKIFIGVESDGLKYSALSMSAGEQRVFYILEKIFRAGKHSLILIDEIDLLLHDSAMKKLVEVIHDRASDKNLQIIATTHRETILAQENLVNIRHIVIKSGRSLCFSETKPDAIKRLTGSQPRPIEVFAEDDLAAAIVKKIASQLKGIKYISVERYGAAKNCFIAVAGLLLGGEECEHSLFVLDGDVYRSDQEKLSCINGLLTGTDRRSTEYRSVALSKISQFELPDAMSPERYLHSIIVSMNVSVNDEHIEIIECAREIHFVDDDHKYIDDLLIRLGWDREVGLSKIVDLVAMSDQWPEYVASVKSWMSHQIDKMSEGL